MLEYIQKHDCDQRYACIVHCLTSLEILSRNDGRSSKNSWNKVQWVLVAPSTWPSTLCFTNCTLSKLAKYEYHCHQAIGDKDSKMIFNLLVVHSLGIEWEGA